MKAVTAMSRNVVCVSTRDTLQDAWEHMRDWHVRHLPVLDGKKLVGIISDRDVLLRSTLQDGVMVVPTTALDEVMTTCVATCALDSSTVEILDTMLTKKVDCVPVMEDGELVGLVTSTDLLEIMRENQLSTTRVTIPFRYRLHQHPYLASSTYS